LVIPWNRPFSSKLVPLFQNEPSRKPFTWKRVWFTWKWIRKRNALSHEWFCTKTWFGTEQKATQKWSVALDMLSAHRFWSHYIISPLARAEGRAHKQNCGFPLHPSPVKKPILNCVNANSIRLTTKNKKLWIWMLWTKTNAPLWEKLLGKCWVCSNS